MFYYGNACAESRGIKDTSPHSDSLEFRHCLSSVVPSQNFKTAREVTVIRTAKHTNSRKFGQLGNERKGRKEREKREERKKEREKSVSIVLTRHRSQ